MYEVIDATPKDIFLTYAVVIASCVIAFFLCVLVFETIVKGFTKWR